MAEKHDDEMERLLFSGSHLQHVNKSHHDIEANALIRKPEPEQDDRSLAAEEAANQEEKAEHEAADKTEQLTEQLAEQLEEEIAAKEEEQAATREQEHEESERANDNEALELSDNEQEEASLDWNDGAEELGKEYEEFLANDLDPDFELQPEDLETTPEEALAPESLGSDTETLEHAVETHSIETQSIEAETAQLDMDDGGGGDPPQQPPATHDFPKDDPEPHLPAEGEDKSPALSDNLQENITSPDQQEAEQHTTQAFEEAKLQAQALDAQWVSGQEQIESVIEGNGVFDQVTAQIVGAELDETVNKPPEFTVIEYTPEQIAQQEAGQERRDAIDAAKVDVDVAVHQHEQSKEQIEKDYNPSDYDIKEPTQENEEKLDAKDNVEVESQDENQPAQELEQSRDEENESALEWNSGDEQQQAFEPDPDSSQADNSNLDWNDGAEQDHSTDMQQSQEQEATPPQIEWNNGSDSPEQER